MKMNLNDERKSKSIRATNKVSLLFLYSSFHCHMKTFNDTHNWFSSDQFDEWGISIVTKIAL
jgi:hypothetical protein